LILTVTLNAAIDKTHLIPGFAQDRVNRPQQVLALAGGKGINVSRVLRTLGNDTVATGGVSGQAGEFSLASLAAEGIAHDFVALDAGESRTCLAVVHPERGTTTEINEVGAAVAPGAFAEFVAKFESLLPASRWVALSGSMPPGLAGEAYLQLMRRAREAGKRVSLDTSGEALQAALAGGPDLLKPNEDEAAWVLGQSVTPETLVPALTALLARGAKAVALTLGARGAAVATRDEAWFYTAPAIDVVNPIGSGDSFLAGLLSALEAGRTLEEAGRLAVACGTANAAVAGAAACSSDLVRTLLPEVRQAPIREAGWASAPFAQRTP
jgi:tagatose 6-phosphate kinase